MACSLAIRLSQVNKRPILFNLLGYCQRAATISACNNMKFTESIGDQRHTLQDGDVG